jgi:hypothetical protein
MMSQKSDELRNGETEFDSEEFLCEFSPLSDQRINRNLDLLPPLRTDKSVLTQGVYLWFSYDSQCKERLLS